MEERFGEDKIGKHVFLGFYQGVSMERTSMTSRLLSCSLSLRRLFSSVGEERSMQWRIVFGLVWTLGVPYVLEFLSHFLGSLVQARAHKAQS